MSAPTSLVGRLRYHAQANPDHDALVSTTTTLSYGQLEDRVAKQARSLELAGITAQSVLGVNCSDDVQHMLLCLAATQLGATSCTIPSYETEQVQADLCERCKVTHVATATEVVSNTDSSDAADRGSVNSARLLFSTSGTTGDPKLVVHQDNDLVAQAHRHIESTQERFACLASVEHNFAKRHRLYAVAAGATNIFIDPASHSLVAQCLSLDANVLHVSAFQAQELLAQPDAKRLASIRLKLGGGHVPLALRRQLKQNITHNLQAGYGTTETGAIAFTDPKDTDAAESVGQPLPGIEVQVVCPLRNPLGQGQRGEIAIRCQGMFREYFNKPQATAERLQNDWFYTGDIGYLDKHQRIHLCGRSDDMFVFNSMNIYPQDIESAILRHPSIADVAVIPKVSTVHGAIPVALLVFKKEVKQRLPEVQEFVKKQVGVRSPRQYIIVSELPKTTAGKTARRSALQLPEQSVEIRRALIKLLDQKQIDQLSPSLIKAFERGDKDIPLKHLDMDSLKRMDLLVSLELEFDRVITPQALSKFRYLGNIAGHLLLPVANEQPEEGNAPLLATSSSVRSGPTPFVIRFFQRIFRFCSTVAQLNRALTTLGVRLTPPELIELCKGHGYGELLPAQSPQKYQMAVSDWLSTMHGDMLRSGKAEPEPFQQHKLAPSVRLFKGLGRAADKRLLICFPPRGLYQMDIPNTVFLQYVDATQFDVLVVAAPFAPGYQLGKSKLLNALADFSHWLAEQELLGSYPSVRTFGFSAGARSAIAMGHLLGAEMAVTVSGRFHRTRHLLENMDELLTLWRTARKGRCSRVLLSYTADNPRDRKYAGLVAKIVNGSKMRVEHESVTLRHLLLQQLLDQGELATYLKQSIFAQVDVDAEEKLIDEMTIRFPSACT